MLLPFGKLHTQIRRRRRNRRRKTLQTCSSLPEVDRRRKCNRLQGCVSFLETPPNRLDARFSIIFQTIFVLSLRSMDHHAFPFPFLPPHNPPLPYGARGIVTPPQQLLQGGLRRIFLCGVDVLSVIPVAGRDREPGDGNVAGPGGTLAPTVREDLILWG